MAFSYEASITINSSQVPNTDQANFPVLVSGTYDSTGGEPDLRSAGNGGHVQNSNGYDVYFYSDSGLTSRIPAEREYYNASTGVVAFWVNVSNVSHTSNTVIYIGYGDATISTDPNTDSTYGATSVWDINYKGVWHLPDGTTLSASDSTGNTNNGTVQGSVPATAGQIDGAASYSNNISNYIDMGANTKSELLGSYTVSAWVNGTSLTTNGLISALMARQNGSDNGREFLFFAQGDGTHFNFNLQRTNGADGFPTVASSSIYNNSTFYFVAVTYDGATLSMYINGALITPTTSTSSVIASDSTRHMTLGRTLGTGGNNYPWNGVIDEARISNTPRLADWLATQYNNQSTPASFYTMGSEQPVTAGSTIVYSNSAFFDFLGPAQGYNN